MVRGSERIFYSFPALCDAISAMAEFMIRVLQRPRAVGFTTMLCDVFSAMADFMVRVLQLPRAVVAHHDVAAVDVQSCAS
jgi:hypothetical protein